MKDIKKKLRNQADKLIQQYIKSTQPYCLVCGNPTWCAHHFIFKSASNALRYHIPNLIPICKRCHYLVHCQPHLVEPVICFSKGRMWYDELLEVKRTGIKENRQWYEENIRELERLINDKA